MEEWQTHQAKDLALVTGHEGSTPSIRTKCLGVTVGLPTWEIQGFDSPPPAHAKMVEWETHRVAHGEA